MNVLSKFLGPLIAALVLASCGGGGGSPGAPVAPVAPPPSGGTDGGGGTGGGGGGDGGSAIVAADLEATTDKSRLLNSGSDSVVLTVTALDSSRNALPGVPVKVAVDNGAVYFPAGGNVTGAKGTVSGTITIGSDKSNRLLHYTVTAGSIVKSGVVSVDGISIQTAASVSAPIPGELVTLRVTVKDAVGVPVSGVDVNLSGLPEKTLGSVKTDINGQAAFTFNAPATGVYDLSVQSAGLTSNYSLVVFAGDSLLAASSDAASASASVNANPRDIRANTKGSNANRSEVQARFYTRDNSPIERMRVRFYITSTSLPGESLSTGSNLVYSGSTGAAVTSYIAPIVGSPTDGVVIKACYSDQDFSDGTCPHSMTTRLTVTKEPTSITIGTDNKIGKTSSGISYVKKFEIQAVDSAGYAIPDVPLSAVVDILGYIDGPSLSGKLDVNNPQMTGDKGYVFCPNEDLNRNGILDQGEDVNGDGDLTPRKSDVSIAFVNDQKKTDANGLANIQLTYPQNVALWELVKITVTAGVAGSEGVATYFFQLAADKADVENGTFLNPPYRRAPSCIPLPSN